MKNTAKGETKIAADFNGLFDDFLCLSHGDTGYDEAGNAVHLRSGMLVTAFEPDFDEQGDRDDLLASGIVEPSPEWLACQGSKWVLRIDADGVHHSSDLSDEP